MQTSGARIGVMSGVAIAAGFVLYQFWVWEIERVEVPPGKFLVKIKLWGKNLPAGEVIAPDDTYKGVQREMPAEGRHFLNPITTKYELHDMRQVPPGRFLVLTRKSGKEIPQERLAAGEFIAEEGERGIIREVRTPGSHRINPYEHEAIEVPMTEIRADQIGVKTLKVGKVPTPEERKKWTDPYVVPEGFRGVQQKQVPSGNYYPNPYIESIVPVDVRSHRVEFADIEFPSKDGFILKPHVLVTYRVIPEKAPEVFVTLTEEGKLEQHDSTPREQERNQILQKIVLPLIRGNTRIEGSKFDARDFISAVVPANAKAPAENPRERLQRELMEKVVPRCAKIGIQVESITLAQMDAPPELATQISQRELARIEREKNADRIGQYKTEQELKATEALVLQNQEKVTAQTRLIVAKAKAQQRKDTEESKLKTELDNAKIQLEAARNKAKEILSIGKADADVINLTNEAEVAGLKRAVSAFPSIEAFAQYHVVLKIAPALTEIFASDGSDFARLFSSYLTPPTAPTPAKTVSDKK